MEGFAGLAILTFFLAIIFSFFIKWWRDYKLTGRCLVLNPKEFKWQILLALPLLILSVLMVDVTIHPPEEIEGPTYKNEEMNPYGWYV